MHTIIAFAKGIIVKFGYAGIFGLTALDHVIYMPMPIDFFATLGAISGLTFKYALIAVLAGALFGSLVSYFIGKKLGHPAAIWLFGHKHVDKAEIYIRKWGFWGLVLAGLAPLPFNVFVLMAGVFEMPILRFILSIFLGRIPRYIVTAFAGAIIYKTKFYATTTMSAIVLGAMQGVTEFLPVSSTGHLVIMEHFLVLPAENLYLFDIFLHGASLLAIFLFFRRDWLHVLSEIGIWFKTRRIHKDSLAFKLMIGTIPAIIAGVLFAGYIEGPLRGMNAVAISFIATGVFYLYAEWKGKHHTAETVTPKKSVIIGLAQAAALVPAVSRSGATIATGMILGLSREAAARFSFMLGGVAILAANVYALIDLDSATRLPDRYFTLTGCITSFLFSLGAIYLLLKFLRRHSLKAFSIYLMIVGVLMLSFF